MSLKLKLSIAILVGYMGFLFYLSSLTNNALIDIEDLINIFYMSANLLTIVIHIVLYTILGILFSVTFRQFGKPLAYGVIASSIYGITDEIHQLFVPTRVCSLFDMGFDALGSLIGMMLFISVLYLSNFAKRS